MLRKLHTFIICIGQCTNRVDFVYRMLYTCTNNTYTIQYDRIHDTLHTRKEHLISFEIQLMVIGCFR